ncbi:MAG TPA: glycosyltransferase family 87 protein [Thermoleophilaceae bacterium]|nr:glycosyltransferase family 87 protein [Thermoleophilaceae bacterium]
MAAQPEPLFVRHFRRRDYGGLSLARALPGAGRAIGVAALVVMVILALQIVGAAATIHPRVLVPSGHLHYPSWMAGPFRGYGDRVPIHELDRLLVILAGLYLVVLACSRVLPAWIAAAGLVVLTALFALAPPLFSTDIFNYVNYARLGVLHHINPYRHGAAAFTADPSYIFTGHRWRHTPTAYGPLFTLLSYAFAGLGVGGAMWALKAVAALAALGTSALIWMCARRLGVRPVPAMLFFGLNPLVLVYAVGGGHNDLLMVLPLVLGAFLILDGRPELGGAALAAAAAVKLTAGLALPFVFLASRSRWRVILGAAIASVVIGIVGLAFFGPHITGMIDVLHNHDELTSEITSVPGYVGHLLGVGGLTPARRVIVQGLFGVASVLLLAYAWRRRNWLAGSAAALVLLVASLGWLLPWYVVWALPLAPLARRRSLPVAALALTGIVLAIQIYIYDNDFNSAGHVHSSHSTAELRPPNFRHVAADRLVLRP